MGSRGICLVIEDDEDVRDLLKIILATAGFTVAVAATGAEGLSLAADLSPVVITVDMGLPDLDGREVTRQLRAFCPAPIVMITAFTQIDDELTSIASGATAYLAKPFRPAQLRSLINRLVPAT